MRVIGGKAKRTKLNSLDIDGLRPMLDRVKESLFNIIQQDIREAIVLDLFSGTGALGIEALSRGASTAVFVEADGRLVDLIGENLDKCNFADSGVVLNRDVMELPKLNPEPLPQPADIVFVDPPYIMIEDPNERPKLISILEELLGSWISREAVLMLHHSPKPHMLWTCKKLRCFDRRVYGRSQLSFFKPVNESNPQ